MSEQSLGKSASRGAAVTLGAQLLRIGIQLGGIVILARLVGPADYGLITMIVAIIGVGEVLRDFGLSQASIQARSVSHGQQSNLFWVNTGIGVALTLITMACSWAIAGFYGHAELQPLTVALSSTFLLRGMTTQFMAHLARGLQFARLSSAEIIGQTAALVVSIGMAFLGFGVWALAAQQIAQAAFTLVLMAGVARWFPGWIDRTASINAFFKFGLGVAGAQVLNYASKNVDSIVIGARFGPAPLGLYNRAFNLMMMPLTQINAPATRVAIPVLSRLQDERKRYEQFIVMGQFAMLLVVGLVISICITQAHALVLIALGRQWLDAVPLFQILAVGGIFQAAGYASYWVFLSKGLTKQNFYYAIASRPITIGIILLGSMWGVVGVAWGYSISLAVFWPISLLWLSRISDAPVGAMWGTAVRCLTVLIVATGAGWAATFAIPEPFALLAIFIGATATLGTVAVAALVWPAFREQMTGVLQLRRFFKGGSSTKGVPA